MKLAEYVDLFSTELKFAGFVEELFYVPNGVKSTMTMMINDRYHDGLFFFLPVCCWKDRY